MTVSKVLRGHSDIGEETRERVLKRIKELNYQPNLAARALVTGRSYSVGLIVPDLQHHFFADVARSMSRVLRPEGFGLLISSSDEDPSMEREEIEHMLARRVDALVIASAQTAVEPFARIFERKTPLILVDRKLNGYNGHFIGINDERAGFLATAHLIESGYQRIAHIRGPQVSTATGRLEGYRKALVEFGLDPAAGLVTSGDSPDSAGTIGGFEGMRQLLRLKQRPDAVFCYNDPVALGAMRAIKDAGLSIPHDVGLIGCGNLLYSDMLRVPLSTIDQSSGIVGTRAAELALNLIKKKDAAPTGTIYFEPILVPRASSAKRQTA